MDNSMTLQWELKYRAHMWQESNCEISSRNENSLLALGIMTKKVTIDHCFEDPADSWFGQPFHRRKSRPFFTIDASNVSSRPLEAKKRIKVPNVIGCRWLRGWPAEWIRIRGIKRRKGFPFSFLSNLPFASRPGLTSLFIFHYGKSSLPTK